MFKNYLKTAFRNLWNNKSYSIINIVGLTIGTLSCLYILLYVQDQYSYDKHHNDAQNIYRITTSLSLKGDKHKNATASPPIAPALKRDFAEVKEYTRVVSAIGIKQHLLRYKEKSFYETDMVYVDSTFFSVFNYHFDSGNPEKALASPYSIVLKSAIADKLFGNENPIGKIIEIDNAYGKDNFTVTGVIDESLGKTHIKASLFVTMNSGGMGGYTLENQSWAGNNFAYSYVKLNNQSDAAGLQKKLPGFLNKYGQEQMKELGMEKQLTLQPITSIKTTPGYEVEMSKTFSPSFLYILILIAAIIQFIACINFMNLSTARASKRAKEVGVRKVIGASRKDLVKQFLGESFIISLIALMLVLPLLVLGLPYLNSITEADIKAETITDYRIWIMLGGLVLVTGFLAGSYPAFYLSAFRVVKVIKGDFSSHISAAGIRRILVVVQFALSVILIAGMVIIYSQLNYINRRDLGFDKSQKLIFSFHTEDAKAKMPAFIDDLRQMAEVKAVSRSNNYLSQFVFNDQGVFLAGGNMANAPDAMNMTTDENFVKANGITIIGGRNFSVTDSGKVLINETLAKRLGLDPKTAGGTLLYTQYAPEPAMTMEIAGVMKDFNFSSLHEEVKPFMLKCNPKDNYLSNITVATNSANYKNLLGQIEILWHKNFPAVPFEYSFLDEEVQKQYASEITLANIINAFTIMAIFISCLGLFGLTSFSADQRKKEIGIRKVLGASVASIIQLLSKEFLRLVLIAIIIATPIAWWSMSKWLQTFNYRIAISWWMFAIAGLLAVIIALATVGYQAMKAAISNPVKSLKTE